MSNEKLYKVSSEDLDKVTKAINIVAALLGKIALSNMIDSAELEPAPASLEQAVDSQAETALDRMEARAHRCHCHRVGEKRRTVETFAKKVLMRKLPKTLKEVAVYTDTDYKKVHKYAYTHNIGKAGHTLDGHQCRILSEADAKALIEHFKK